MGAQKEKRHELIAGGLLLLLGLATAMGLHERAAAQSRRFPQQVQRGEMLGQGIINFSTPEFDLSLVRSSQTIAALKPNGADGFDFTPGDLLEQRSTDGYYHLGDIDLRLRAGTSGNWRNYSTAFSRKPVAALPVSGTVLAEADLKPTLPDDFPLKLRRTWAVETGKLVLRFTLTNQSGGVVQVGALGIPMVFNNVLTGRSLEQAHVKCSFYDPYIGEDAGYLQVTRLNGHGPALLVVPDGRTPFEAYKPILDDRDSTGAIKIFNDPTPRGVTFEGFYDWMVFSKAYAENEWKNARPWNPATMLTLAPGESKSYGVKFLVSDSIRDIEKTLAANGRPVAVGIPGYVLPTDIDARLFVKYPRPIRSVSVNPEGAISVRDDPHTRGNWDAFTLHGRKWGRSRVTITYQDGLVQTINYFVMKPESQAVADLGDFLMTRQWFTDPHDPFHRSPSVMTYDRQANAIVTQDPRVWIAGLSDEGGAGSWLAAAMKEFGEPDKSEIDKYQQFVDHVLWGGIQYKTDENDYGVRKSLFYYQPGQILGSYYRSDFDWSSWTSWTKKESEAVNRSYNYPHVAAAYWALYRLARYHQGLVTNHSWQWYLMHAYHTSIAMTEFAPGLARFGQMEGDIFLKILLDLKREGLTTAADHLEEVMRERADRWRQEPYPFGSEMPWDSTGQEEVYAWMKYFGYQNKADVTLNAILGYDPTIPNWGYNGSARRYWDFIYAGKIQRLERQLHHYGSGINAIPLLAEYRDHPGDFYVLRVGYGGTMGALTDIDQEGFASAAFHSFPDMMKFDPYSGDYGTNFFGHALNTATYVMLHPEFGWLAFGGNLRVEGNIITVAPLDSFRQRVYLAPLGLWLTLDAGKFTEIDLNAKTGAVRVGLAPATAFTPTAFLRIEQPAKIGNAGMYRPSHSFQVIRGAYAIGLAKSTTRIELEASR